jgi:GAF domain-containing protein
VEELIAHGFERSGGASGALPFPPPIVTMSKPKPEDLRSDGAFSGSLDQETFSALLFSSFLHQQEGLRAAQREHRLAAIAETRRAAAGCADLRAALNLVAARAVEVTGSSGSAIAIGSEGQMTCWAASGPTAPPLGAALPLDSGLSGECLRTRRTLRCDDAASDARVNREACARLGGVGSMLLVPLCRGNHAIGILEVFSTKPRGFDESDEHAVELLAMIASAAHREAEGEAAPRVSRSSVSAGRSLPSPVSPA